MVYTMVLEAIAERIESSSLSLPTNTYRGIGVIGNALALQAWVRSSNLLSSTKGFIWNHQYTEHVQAM